MNVAPGKDELGPHKQGVRRLNNRHGRSVSGAGAATDLSTSPSNNKFNITINGDGPHLVTLPNTQNLVDGNHIGDEIEKQVRVLRANNPTLDRAFSQFRCDFLSDVGRYILVSGEEGPASAVVVTDAVVGNVASMLQLGITNGGTEDAFFPRQTRYASLVDVATLPMPVEIVGIDEITIDHAQIDTQVTHLDNDPDTGDVHDSLRIGDGTEELAINPDGSINVVTAAYALTTPTIANISVPLANTEYSYTFPTSTKKMLIRVRDSASKMQIAFAAGTTNTNFLSISAGAYYSADNLTTTAGFKIYFMTTKPSQVVEILSWV